MDLNTYEASQEPLRQLARNYPRSGPCFAGLPFLLLGLSTLSKRYGWVRRVTTRLHSFFVDQGTPRKTEQGTEDFHVAVGNPTFRRRHNYLV
jgi:hypothetical protein